MNLFKRYTMKNKLCSRLNILAVSLVLLCCGCKKTYDFLNLPDNQFMDARIWENEGAVQYLVDEAYWISMPEFPWHNATNNNDVTTANDESVFSATKEWTQRYFNVHAKIFNGDDFKYIGTKYQGENVGDNRYYEIARCNLALKMLPDSKGIIPAKVKWFMGQFQLIRAIIYLNLMKYYGGVPIVTDPLSPQTIEPLRRAKAKEVLRLIVADCDAAIKNLEGIQYVGTAINGNYGKLTRGAAAAWKARALWWWASPLFNPIGDPAHPHDAGRWVEANKAAREAYEMCKTDGYGLISNYGSIFQLEGPYATDASGNGTGNKEAIIIRSYSALKPKRGNNVEAKSRPSSENGSPDDCYRPTTKLLEAYCMKDGIPITDAAVASQYPYDANHIWLNRDPRFDASIGYNGGLWALSGKSTRRQWSYEGEASDGKVPFYCKRFTFPNLPKENVKQSGDFGGAGMDWIDLRFAEVMLIYAETANEAGETAIAQDMVRQIRQRAGVEAGNKDYGLAMYSGKDAMRELIYNERMVEFALEGKRNDDLRRTRRMHLLTGSTLSYPKILKTTAKKFWIGPKTTDSADVKTWLVRPLATDATRTNRDTLNINNPATADIFFLPYDGTGGTPLPISFDPQKYFFALNNFYLFSSALLEQTAGWNGGTFDPLETK
jgi:hypothetical protein